MAAASPRAALRALSHRALVGAVLLAVSASTAGAQFVVRPFLEWRTLETQHFAFHFPRDAQLWTLDVAERMEAVRSAVGGLVGSVPARKVNVIVDDPFNLPNGFAIPPLDWPIIVLWTTPPTPRQEIGQYRSWGELLAVHEFAHVAHLTWADRNPFQRLIWRLLPAEIGPVLRRSPRWAIEGYATYIEGRVTGTGRPYNVWRPAILRQWALEGRMPTYSQLNTWNAYEGGAFAYLAGSAYFEWLARRQGDSSLVHLWRRLSARRNRSFGQAFSGLFGDSPDALYGRFVAELTGNALAVERRIEDAGGVVAGSIVQRLSWETGDPAISPDGRNVAVVLRSDRRPARLVVWATGPDSQPPRRRAARPPPPDPLDVPDRRFYPPPKRARATLEAAGGLAYEDPRFFSDNQRILLSRLTPRGDGSLTPDLYVWRYTTRELRRITRRAGVRTADPAPDGLTAVGTRCSGGSCDLVLVNVRTGALTTLQPGSPNLSYHRPRFSPDGRTVAVSVQQGGRWRVAIVDVATRTSRLVDPGDDAARYDVEWLPDGNLVWVSELGGIPNIELFDLSSRVTRTVTRVTGAALAPEPNPADGSLWFLALHSRGLDVRRLVPDSVRLGSPLAFPARLAPAVPVRPDTAPDTLRRGAVGAVRPYGIGPRQLRWFPGFSGTADGIGGEFLVSNADPVGRLTLRASGAYGQTGTWRGARGSAAWRRRVGLIGEAYVAEQQPSRRFVGPLGEELDLSLVGADLRLDALVDYWSAQHRFQLGGAVARIDARAETSADRTRALGFAELDGTYRQRLGELRFAQAYSIHADVGGIGGDRFSRGVLSVALAASGRIPFGGVHVSGSYGEIRGATDSFERFSVGGSPVPLVGASVLPQRIPMPALPTGVATGERVLTYRIAVPSGPLWPYYWGASVAEGDDGFRTWNRVYGAELRLGADALPIVALPRVQFVVGYGRSVDPPYRRGNRFYGALTYR